MQSRELNSRETGGKRSEHCHESEGSLAWLIFQRKGPTGLALKVNKELWPRKENGLRSTLDLRAHPVALKVVQHEAMVSARAQAPKASNQLRAWSTLVLFHKSSHNVHRERANLQTCLSKEGEQRGDCKLRSLWKLSG